MSLGNPVLLKHGTSQVSSSDITRLVRVPMQGYKETFLQELIDLCPDVLPVADFFPLATKLFSLGREIEVDHGGSTGYIDNILITDDGHLVIVETKLHRNNESARAVIAQALHYCMAISELSDLGFEKHLRRAQGPNVLPAGKSISEYLRSKPGHVLPAGFEMTFDRFRETGEILLLVVGDGIRLSATRLVEWMNSEVGNRPYQFGLVELRMYEEVSGKTLIVPTTLLKTREASRHVISIHLKEGAKTAVEVIANAPDGTLTASAKSKSEPISEEALFAAIEAGNPAPTVQFVRSLVESLRMASFKVRSRPSMLQWGVEIGTDDFVSLVSLSGRNIWVQIPRRASKALGADGFVEAKQILNSVEKFYRTEDVQDPTKTDALTPQYTALHNSVGNIVTALRIVADAIIKVL